MEGITGNIKYYYILGVCLTLKINYVTPNSSLFSVGVLEQFYHLQFVRLFWKKKRESQLFVSDFRYC